MRGVESVKPMRVIEHQPSEAVFLPNIKYRKSVIAMPSEKVCDDVVDDNDDDDDDDDAVVAVVVVAAAVVVATATI